MLDLYLLDEILQLGIVVGLGLNHGPLLILLQHVFLRGNLGRLWHACKKKINKNQVFESVFSFDTDPARTSEDFGMPARRK